MQGLICLNGDIIRKDTINQMPPGNAKSLMDSVFDLAQRINQFRLSDAEIGLFCAVVIIAPGKIADHLPMNYSNSTRLLLYQTGPDFATPTSCSECSPS